MKDSHSESYKAAGVDVTAGYEAVRLMLVSGTDGVGTKIKLAFLLDKHDTIGIDAVAMCVNDIICCGARPLYFLDYIACGKNEPAKIASIVKGIADGCVESGCALIGGETAEHPGLMPEDEYDVGGFSVGIVSKRRIIDGSKVTKGDAVIGLASSGVHSNGFSLVRKVFGIDKREVLDEKLPDGRTLGETLLTPTKLYVKPMLDLISKVDVRAVSHITGGGFYENIPRSIPEGLTAVINKGSWEIPYIFTLLQERGGISEHDMFNTFNMGIGMSVVVPEADADKAVEVLNADGCKAYRIGTIDKTDKAIVIQ